MEKVKVLVVSLDEKSIEALIYALSTAKNSLQDGTCNDVYLFSQIEYTEKVVSGSNKPTLVLYKSVAIAIGGNVWSVV